MIAIFNSTPQLMRQVIYAMVLGIAASFYYFGWTVLLQIVLAVLTAIVVEIGFLRIRKRDITAAADGSAIITALLLALSIPAIAPWWIVVLGTAFAIIFGKQLFGGLGNNPFNPAMLGYAFLLISYPLQMTSYGVGFVDFTNSIEVIFNAANIDAISGATNLDIVRTQLSLGKLLDDIIYSASSFWVNIGFLLGGIYLLLRRVIFWQIPVSFLAGMVLMSEFLHLIDPQIYLSSAFHLTSGAAMLGAFFIATDPVSSSTTPKGRLIYGFLIGILIIIIRVFGGYPDGVAFAVLLINITVPLLDTYTKPKVFGIK